MQEDIQNKMVALSVKATKFTARALAKALMAALRKIQKSHQMAQAPQGRQSVKKLMNHRVSTNSMPLDGNTRLWDQVARKYNVDYAFHKTGSDKYLLFFKAGQADAITSAFADYTKRVVARGKERRLPIRDLLKRFAELVHTQPRQQERKREGRNDR